MRIGDTVRYKDSRGTFTVLAMDGDMLWLRRLPRGLSGEVYYTFGVDDVILLGKREPADA